MNIDLEAKCTATHQWVLVGKFTTAAMANEAAEALSNIYKHQYRTIDRRWPDEGVITTVFGVTITREPEYA